MKVKSLIEILENLRFFFELEKYKKFLGLNLLGVFI